MCLANVPSTHIRNKRLVEFYYFTITGVIVFECSGLDFVCKSQKAHETISNLLPVLHNILF